MIRNGMAKLGHAGPLRFPSGVAIASTLQWVMAQRGFSNAWDSR